MRLPVLLLLALPALAPHAAGAQDASVPADLFYAVANVRDASGVTVGEAPARLVSLFPEGADVLGSLHKTAVGRVSEDPEDVAQFYAATPPAGWRPHDYWNVGDEGGFVRSPVQNDGTVLCPSDLADGSEPVRIRVSERPGGGAFLTVSEGGWYRVGCDGTLTNPPVRFQRGSAPEVELTDLPPLSPPAGGRQETNSSGGSTDYQRQEASLTWTGSASDALAHYADQLEAAGWLPLAAGGDEESAAGTWTQTTAEGPRTVTLAAVQTERGSFALRLTLASYGS